jgi:hypothetical protein
MTLSTGLSADAGDSSGFWLQSLLADLAFPKSFVGGELAAASRSDALAARRYYSSSEHLRPSLLGPGNPGTDFIWGDGKLVNAWPSNGSETQYTQVRKSKVATLLIGGEVDFATPPQTATKELLPYLPNGRQVVLPATGHTTSFWEDQPDAGTHLINTYLDGGRVDRSLYKPVPVDFTPEVTQTALAKGIGIAMLALAVLTVLSLLWMAIRAQRRARFGRKSSALLRSLYPVVLGFGGWFLGVIIVVTAFPGTPLDDELLAVLSMGVPIGLGAYWAWVDGAWVAGTKTVGFAAATAGALIGALLGFNATTGLLAVITTIVGAAAGANLALVGLDIAWDRQVHDRFASVKPEETPEARASTV